MTSVLFFWEILVTPLPKISTNETKGPFFFFFLVSLVRTTWFQSCARCWARFYRASSNSYFQVATSLVLSPQSTAKKSKRCPESRRLMIRRQLPDYCVSNRWGMPEKFPRRSASVCLQSERYKRTKEWRKDAVFRMKRSLRNASEAARGTTSSAAAPA